MISIPEACITALKSDHCEKLLDITINGVTFDEKSIYKDGLRLTETVMDGKPEFVGCIASIFEFKVAISALPKADYNGQAVSASLAVAYESGDTILYQTIPLFNGYVDSCEKSADGYYQSFVCYDKFAILADLAGYNAYKSAFTTTTIDLATFKSNVLASAGLNMASQTLANDGIKFRKRKRNKDITILNLLRQISQIYGGFGMINRYGRFEVKFIDDGATPENIPYYRSLDYSDYVTLPVGNSSVGGSVTIRTNSQDAGVTVDWSNYTTYAGTDPGWSDESQDTYIVDDDDTDVVLDSYVVENNLIAYRLSAAKKRVIAANILASIGNDAAFRDYTLKCNGLPYLECCDKVITSLPNGTQKEFIITKRVLEGLQAMTDTYTCTVEAASTSTASTTSTTERTETIVSNVDQSTQGLSDSFEQALTLEEKTITLNGVYMATDDGAEGYSKVTVNIQGAPDGYRVSATALEDISALATVAVTIPQGAQSASVVPTSIPANVAVGAGRTHLYYLSGTSLYKVPFDALTDEPTEVLSSISNASIMRNLCAYTKDGTHYLMNLNDESTTTLATAISLTNVRGTDSSDYFKASVSNDPKCFSISTASIVASNAYGATIITSPSGHGYSLYRLFNRTHKRLYSAFNASPDMYLPDIDMNQYTYNVIGSKIIGIDASNVLCYTSTGSDTSVTYFDEALTMATYSKLQYSNDGIYLYTMTTSGLALFTENGVQTFADITSMTTNLTCLIGTEDGNLFWTGSTMYLLGGVPTMQNSSSIGDGDLYGFAAESVDVGAEGVAIILFS